MGPPGPLAQLLFALNFLNTLLVLWTLCKLLHNLPGLGARRRRESLCIAVSSFCFRNLMLRPSPWVRLHGMDGVERAFAEMASHPQGLAPYVLANHNSKLDSLLVTAILPPELGPRMRSLIKLDLFSEPLFGGICEAVGHFPVFFKGKKAGDFGVDKERQAKVSADMDSFLGNGGGLLLFPEGQLNKTPRTLQTLRRGAFTLPIQHKRALWGFINVGCETCWPYTQFMGGFPTDIYVRAFKITDDASQFDNIQLAEHAGQVMQKHLDELYAIADGTGASSAIKSE